MCFGFGLDQIMQSYLETRLLLARCRFCAECFRVLAALNNVSRILPIVSGDTGRGARSLSDRTDPVFGMVVGEAVPAGEVDVDCFAKI